MQRLWITALFALSHAVLSLSQCRNGWLVFNRSCYLFAVTKESWSEAMLHCRIYGANLAEVDSAEENVFFEREAKSMNAALGFWLGGTDTEIEGDWRWATSDTEFDYKAWDTSEPNSVGHDEDCLEFSPDGYWNDLSCHNAIYFICEYKPTDGSEVVG